MPSFTADTNCNDCGTSFAAATFGKRCPFCWSTDTDVFRYEGASWQGEPLSVAEARRACGPPR